jgi:hypothetical protein
LIEDQVEETSIRLKKELDISLQQRRTHETHEKLAELKVEYDRKMLIIDEIKREKEYRDKLEI